MIKNLQFQVMKRFYFSSNQNMQSQVITESIYKIQQEYSWLQLKEQVLIDTFSIKKESTMWILWPPFYWTKKVNKTQLLKLVAKNVYKVRFLFSAALVVALEDTKSTFIYNGFLNQVIRFLSLTKQAFKNLWQKLKEIGQVQ